MASADNETGPNGTPSPDSKVKDYSLFVFVFFVTCLTIVIFITIVGNVIVCMAVTYDRKLRSLTNCFIVSLATTDLLLGILVMPFSAINEFKKEWPLGATFCNIYISLDVMLCTASILNLFAISLDRYYAVTTPLKYTMVVTSQRVAIGMGIIWVVSLMVSFLPIHLGWNTKDFKVQNTDNETHCEFKLNMGYVLVDGFCTFYFPLVVMIITYHRIFKIAREQAKRINNSSCYNTVKATSPVIKEHKATVTLAAVMGAFIICWFPYFTVFVYQGVSGQKADTILFSVVLWLGYINSALNPILYGALNRDFRMAYQRLLRCRRIGLVHEDSNITPSSSQKSTAYKSLELNEKKPLTVEETKVNCFTDATSER
ncbi:histamine H2 receptor [Protopterus annectens]|uniref:histamine H2 receptor n=1 Tax=Protopterus annectens TaxID=7888 RepID=UPI001CF95400|nr:histamine H2 receptor [Protopterus annectens]